MAKRITTKDVLRMLGEIRYFTGKMLNSRIQFQIPSDVKKVISEEIKEFFLEHECSDSLENITNLVVNHKKGFSCDVVFDVKSRGNSNLIFITGEYKSEVGEDVFGVVFAKNGKEIDGICVPIEEVRENILDN